MTEAGVVRHYGAARWALPIAVAAVVAAIASGAFRASADADLPPRSAAQLLADVENASVPAFQGTVVEKAALGLPDLPSVGPAASGTSMLALLTGSHTAKIWYGGPTRQRVALLDSVGETDLFHDGSDVWQWDSNSRTATHMTLPTPSSAPQPLATGTLTPDQLAQQALAAIDPTTKVSIDAERIVAGQKAYELVLEPRDSASRIGSVRIAIDGATNLPLGVQVYGSENPDSPALDVSFTSIDYGQPESSMFTFTPPAGATVDTPPGGGPDTPPGGGPDIRSGGGPDTRSGVSQAAAEPAVIGSGWTSIAFLRTPAGGASNDPAMLSALTPVSGTWGSGHLLDSALLSALVTDDGRVFAGPVDPSALYAAAASHK